MALTPFTNSFTHGAVDQAAHTELLTMQGGWIGNTELVLYGFEWGVGALTAEGPLDGSGRFGFSDPSGYQGNHNYSYVSGLLNPGYVVQAQVGADITHLFRVKLHRYDPIGSAFLGVAYSGNDSFKTDAVTPQNLVAGSASNITTTSADLTFSDFRVNTNESTASAMVEYRKQGDVAWLQAGSTAAGLSGYGAQSITRNASGLLSGTTYEFRLHLTRTTNNVTDVSTVVYTFTTSTAVPSITTDPASSIGPTSAVLNGTLDPNLNSTVWYFEWGLTVAYGNTTVQQGPSSSGSPFAISDSITGLSPNTTYHFRAVAKVGATVYNGSDRSFITTAPSGTQDKLMPNVIGPIYGKYGQAITVYFPVETPVSTGSDQFLSAAVPWVAGDVKVHKDGDGGNDIGTLPTRIGATPVYTFSLTAAEMQAQQVSVLLRDASGGPLWRDLMIIIITRLRVGQIDVDATNIGGNTDAMSLRGVGSGYGLFATGGSGIRAVSLAAGHGISAVGAGAGQGIDSLGGASGRVCNFFDTLEGAEPSGAPTANMTVMRNLQYIRRRETNRVTQTSSLQVWYKDDSVTILAQRAVSDDLVTQVQGKLV